MGVRGRARRVRQRRRGLVDGRAARARRRRDPLDVGRAAARLHGVDRPSAAPGRDREAVRRPLGGRRDGLRRRRGGDLLPHEHVGRRGRPCGRDLAGLPVAVRGGAGLGREGRAAPAARGRRLVARCRPAHPLAPRRDADGRRQRAAPADRDAARPRRSGGVSPPSASSRGIRLVADEVYRFLEHDGAATLPAGADLDDRAVSIGVHVEDVRDGRAADRLAGDEATTRCSSAVRDSRTTRRSARQRPRRCSRSSACAPATGWSREAARSSGPTWRSLDDFFARRADAFTWVRPRGGSTGFPRLVADGPAGRSADAFAARLVESTGVLLLPSSTFGFDDTHFRIGLGRTDLPVALEKLEAFLGS